MNTPLKAGDEMKCWHCSGWHVLEASPYRTWMLFIWCAGERYYAGTIGIAPDQQTRPAVTAASPDLAGR